MNKVTRSLAVIGTLIGALSAPISFAQSQGSSGETKFPL